MGAFKHISLHQGCLIQLAREGTFDKYTMLRPLLPVPNNIYDDGVYYPCFQIDTAFWRTKGRRDRENITGPIEFQSVFDDFFADIA